ncbi:MAG: DUF1298 domain-containing protein [Acidimicrobiales bacterium]|nr:DUF1298 domain-containing protein [Acidimicrobiales bacterium]
MSPLDHLLWLTDNQPDLRSAMTSLAVFEGDCDTEAVTRRFASACARVDRLRQRVVHNPVSIAPPRWEIDPHFDLAEHLRFASGEEAPDHRTLLDQAATIAAGRLPKDRAQWRVLVIPALADGGWALIMQAHHALADGLGALQIQLALFDLDSPTSDTPDGDDDTTSAPRPYDGTERVVDAALWQARRGLDVLDRSAAAVGRGLVAPRAAMRRAQGTAASLARTLRQPRNRLSSVYTERGGGVRLDVLELALPELKAAARRFGTRLNAVFLAGYADGLRRHHERHGRPVEALRLGLPVSTRADSGAAGNHIVPIRIDLPLRNAGPADLSREIEAAVDEARSERTLELLPDLVLAATRLPPPLAIRAYREVLSGIDVQASNLPGSPLPAYLAGSKLVAQYPFGPLAASACNVTLLSYCDAAHVGVTTSPAAIADPEAFVADLVAGFDAILDI